MPRSNVRLSNARLSDREMIEALIDHEALYACGACLPSHAENSRGRPADYPLWVMLFFDACVSIFKSAHKAEANLPTYWPLVRAQYHALYPNEPRLRFQAPQRHHWQEMKKKVTVADLDAMRDVFRLYALRDAIATGLLDPNGPGSWTHPHLTRMVYGDGVVETTLTKYAKGTFYVDRVTGEIKERRYDDDALTFTTGVLDSKGKRVSVRGLKMVFLCVSGLDRYSRIILDFDRCDPSGDEMPFLLGSLDVIAPRAPGLQGFIWDGVPRGVHIAEIGRKHGLHVINRVMPSSGGHTTGQPAVYKPWRIGPIDIRRPNGTIERGTLYGIEGQAHLHDIDHAGKDVYIELTRLSTRHQPNIDGTFRLYNVWAVPKSHGGGTVSEALLHPDPAKRATRSERLRSISPKDPDFATLYGRRNDAENHNSERKASCWNRRAHSYGSKNNRLDWFGWAILNNALARYRHRQRQAASTPPKPPQPSRPTPAGKQRAALALAAANLPAAHGLPPPTGDPPTGPTEAPEAA